jgi:hypothetical protein
MQTNGRRAWRLLGLATVVVLAGCSSTETEPDAATELLFSPEGTATAAATSEPTAEPAATLGELPDDCGGVIATADVVRIVGVPLAGETTYVFADALPDIGRTGRVTCGYGAEGEGADEGEQTDEGDGPKVEVTVNDYEGEEAAQDRIDVTLQAASERGNEVRDQAIGPYQGYVLADDDDASIVVDVGPRTLVITMQRGLVSAEAEVVVLERLASAVLRVPSETVEPEDGE